MPVKTQILIEGNINKIIDNVRNGKEDMDLNPIIDDLRQERGEEIIENVKKGKGEDFKWPEIPAKTQDLIQEIKDITAGNDKVQKGLKVLMRFMPDGA